MATNCNWRLSSLLYKILGDEVGLKVELQRGNFSNGTPAGSGGHAWNTVRFDDGSSAIFDAMHNKTSVTTPGQVDDYAKQYFAMDNTPLYNEGLKPLDVQQPKIEPSVNPKSDIQNPEINTPAGRIESSMDSMSEMLNVRPTAVICWPLMANSLRLVRMTKKSPNAVSNKPTAAPIHWWLIEAVSYGCSPVL